MVLEFHHSYMKTACQDQQGAWFTMGGSCSHGPQLGGHVVQAELSFLALPFLDWAATIPLVWILLCVIKAYGFNWCIIRRSSIDFYEGLELRRM